MEWNWVFIFRTAFAMLRFQSLPGGGGGGGEFNSDAVHAYSSDLFSIIIL